MAQNVPFNIRKVNGQWLFTTSIFGQGYPSVAQELLIVPEDLLPDLTYSGSKGYIPEAQIANYFNSQRFIETAKSVAVAKGGDLIAGGRGIDAVTAARSIGGNVSAALAKVNGEANALAAKAGAKFDRKAGRPIGSLKNTRSADRPELGSTLPAGDEWIGTASILAESGGQALQSDGENVFRGEQKVYLLPGPIDGRFGKKTTGLAGTGMPENDLLKQISNMDTGAVRMWQKALGMPVNGIYTSSIRDEILKYSSMASQENYRRLMNNQTFNTKPLSALDFVKLTKASSGASRTSTHTESSITQFTAEAAGSLITDIFQNLVGRDPSQQEAQQWMQKLNAAGKKNPNTGTSTTTQTGNSSHTSTVSKAGFGENEAKMLVRNQLAMSPESQSLMASTNLYDAFLEAIQNPMG